MKAIDVVSLLQRYKNKNGGVLPKTPSKLQPNLTKRQYWYFWFGGMLQVHPRTEIPDDLSRYVVEEFGSEEENLPVLEDAQGINDELNRGKG